MKTHTHTHTGTHAIARTVMRGGTPDAAFMTSAFSKARLFCAGSSVVALKRGVHIG